MTSRFPRCTFAIVTVLLIAISASGCSRFKRKKTNENEGVPVVELYERGHTAMRRGNWLNALTAFRRLVAQYPYGDYTEQALMESAYAQFKMGNNEEAISSIDRFLRTYPTHRHTAYMYYLRGLVNSNRDTVFLQRVWNLDASRRDLATPTQAYSDFNIVTSRFPNSRYAADAAARMAELRDMFARHDVEVALYYLRRGAWIASAERARYVLETWPQNRFQYDAVAILAASYTRLGNTTLATDAERILRQNDPQHAYFTGRWPRYPWNIRKLNPFAGEKSALDNDK